MHSTEGAGDAQYVLSLGKEAVQKGGKTIVNNNPDQVNEDQFVAAYKISSANKNNQSLWNDFINKAGIYFAMDQADNDHINNACWFIYENYSNFNDRTALQSAKEWSAKSVSSNPGSSYYNDTYAHILFDLGEYTTAVKHEDIALQKAIQNGDKQEDIDFYRVALARFKGAK